jgi:hypothetical protein
MDVVDITPEEFFYLAATGWQSKYDYTPAWRNKNKQ